MQKNFTITRKVKKIILPLTTTNNTMENQPISFVIKNNWVKDDCGWGNGYVAVPPTHPLHNVDFNSWEDDVPSLNIPSEITWSNKAGFLKGEPTLPSDWWVLGFDTRHRGETLKNRPKNLVEKWTEKLLQEVIKYKAPVTEGK